MARPRHQIDAPKVCPRCKVEKHASEFRVVSTPGRAPALSRCLECDRAYIRNWSRLNPEKRRSASQKHYYEKGGREKGAVRAAATRKRLRDEVFAAYGGRCACCGESEKAFLSVDHIHGDGADHRREIDRNGSGSSLYVWLRQHGFPKDRFRLLCFNCNCARGFRGTCPHEVAAYDVPYAVNMESV